MKWRWWQLFNIMYAKINLKPKSPPNRISPSFWLSAGSLWHSLTYKHITMISAFISHGILPCVQICISRYMPVSMVPFFYKDTSHFGLRHILLWYDLILTNYTCNDLFPTKITLGVGVLGVRTEENSSTPNSFLDGSSWIKCRGPWSWKRKQLHLYFHESFAKIQHFLQWWMSAIKHSSINNTRILSPVEITDISDHITAVSDILQYPLRSPVLSESFDLSSTLLFNAIIKQHLGYYIITLSKKIISEPYFHRISFFGNVDF